MELFSQTFILQVRTHPSPKDLFHSFVVSEIIKFTETDFDEHDRAAEVNIFSEMYLNSYQFAALQMCFDDLKVGQLLHVTHCMLDYDIFLPAERKLGTGEVGVVEKAKKTFEAMRKQLMSQAGVFSVEEIKTISEFFVQWYISNLRLYNHSLSGKQRTDTKIVSIYVDEPMATLPLSKAVERIKLPKEELSESMSRFQKVSRRVTLLKQMSSAKLSQAVSPRQQPESPQDMLDKRIETLTTKLSDDIDRRDQMLEKLLDEARGKKK